MYKKIRLQKNNQITLLIQARRSVIKSGGPQIILSKETPQWLSQQAKKILNLSPSRLA